MLESEDRPATLQFNSSPCENNINIYHTRERENHMTMF